MSLKTVVWTGLCLTSCLFSTAHAGETLNRVKQHGELVAVMDQSYPPYSFLNAQNQMDGFDVDVVKAVAQRLGVKTKIETPSWEVITAGNWRGRWDICICSMTPDQQKARVLDFVAPYYNSPAVLVTNAKGGLDSVQAMEGKQIGVEQGSTYERFLQKDLTIGFGAKPVQYPFKSVMPKTYSSEDLAYQDLGLGAGKRLDGIVSNMVTAEARLKAHPGIFKIVGKPLYEEPNWVAVDKGDKEWDAQIKQIITQMHQDGTLSKISQKWIGADVTKPE